MSDPPPPGSPSSTDSSPVLGSRARSARAPHSPTTVAAIQHQNNADSPESVCSASSTDAISSERRTDPYSGERTEANDNASGTSGPSDSPKSLSPSAVAVARPARRTARSPGSPVSTKAAAGPGSTPYRRNRGSNGRRSAAPHRKPFPNGFGIVNPRPDPFPDGFGIVNPRPNPFPNGFGIVNPRPNPFPDGFGIVNSGPNNNDDGGGGGDSAEVPASFQISNDSAEDTVADHGKYTAARESTDLVMAPDNGGNTFSNGLSTTRTGTQDKQSTSGMASLRTSSDSYSVRNESAVGDLALRHQDDRDNNAVEATRDNMADGQALSSTLATPVVARRHVQSSVASGARQHHLRASDNDLVAFPRDDGQLAQQMCRREANIWKRGLLGDPNAETTAAPVVAVPFGPSASLETEIRLGSVLASRSTSHVTTRARIASGASPEDRPPPGDDDDSMPPGGGDDDDGPGGGSSGSGGAPSGGDGGDGDTPGGDGNDARWGKEMEDLSKCKEHNSSSLSVVTTYKICDRKASVPDASVDDMLNSLTSKDMVKTDEIPCIRRRIALVAKEINALRSDGSILSKLLTVCKNKHKSSLSVVATYLVRSKPKQTGQCPSNFCSALGEIERVSIKNRSQRIDGEEPIVKKRTGKRKRVARSIWSKQASRRKASRLARQQAATPPEAPTSPQRAAGSTVIDVDARISLDPLHTDLANVLNFGAGKQLGFKMKLELQKCRLSRTGQVVSFLRATNADITFIKGSHGALLRDMFVPLTSAQSGMILSFMNGRLAYYNNETNMLACQRRLEWIEHDVTTIDALEPLKLYHLTCLDGIYEVTNNGCENPRLAAGVFPERFPEPEAKLPPAEDNEMVNDD